MLDVAMPAALSAMNVVVAVLNNVAWTRTRDARDMVGAIAWYGSAAYWMIRALIEALA